MKLHRLALTLLLTCAPASLCAQTATDNVSLYLKTTEGESVSGKFLGLQGDRVRLGVSVLGGTMTVTHNLSDFQPESAFKVELAANPPTDYASHFAMAKKAAEMGLLQVAGAQARAALKAAEGGSEFEQQRAAVRTWAADALEKMVADSVAGGDQTQARSCLKLLTTRFADLRTEEQLDAIAAPVEAMAQTARDKREAARQARVDAKVRDSNNRKLASITKSIDAGEKDYRNAVRKSRNTTASKNLCESAIGHFKKAYKALEELLTKNPEDTELAAAAAPLGQQIHTQGIGAALHAANMLCVQSDYKGAMDWAQRVLAFDPGNTEAKEMVQTITIASAEASDNWGWTWPTVGRSSSQNR